MIGKRLCGGVAVALLSLAGVCLPVSHSFATDKAVRTATKVVGSGSYTMGLDVTKRTACRRARESAIDAAIRQVAPETLSSGEWMICREGKASEECRINSMVWGRVNGQLHDISDEKEWWDGGTCNVELQARVRSRGEVDPSFDLKVELNRTIFRDRDRLEITVQPTTPMYTTVFQWLPYVDSEESVQRLFPNERDPARRVTKLSTIPTPGKNYSMQVRFPDTVGKGVDEAMEFIMVVATTERVSFLESFSLEEFESKLAELSSKQYRLKRRGYQVVRGR